MIGVRHPHWPGLVTGLSETLNTNGATWGGFTTRNLIPASSFLWTGVTSFVQVRLVPCTAGSNTPINNCFIGHAAVAPNFDGNQKRVTFNGGSSSVTLVAAGAPVLSDIIGVTLSHLTDIILAFDYGGTADVRFNTAALAGVINYNKAAVAEAGTTSVSGYGAVASRGISWDLIQVG